MMIWFWFAAMLGIALLFVLPPLLRRPRPGGPGHNETNIALHRKRLTELEADLAAGSLNETQFAHAREDLERELLQEIDSTAVTAAPAPRAARFSAIVLALVIPALALGLYYRIGGWRSVQSGANAPAMAQTDGGVMNAAPQSAAPDATAPNNTGMPSIDEMVKRLEGKLAKDPNNAQGWTMLGRSYVYLNRYSDAVRAYAQAEALTDPPDAQVLAEYAEALALANGNRMSGAPERLAQKALKLAPDNPNALWLAGMAAFQQHDFKTALKYWEPLQKVTAGDSEQGRVLQDYLAQARSGKPLETIAQPDAPAPAADNTPPSPAAASGTALKVHVALDPAVAAKAAPDDTVFVFARAVQGPPMPLAIVRKQVRDLPLDVTLDDSLAMMPAMKLSNFAKVTVGARVSKSGNAMPASGDLQGSSGEVQTQHAAPLDITINQVVP